MRGRGTRAGGEESLAFLSADAGSDLRLFQRERIADVRQSASPRGRVSRRHSFVCSLFCVGNFLVYLSRGESSVEARVIETEERPKVIEDVAEDEHARRETQGVRASQ